MGELRDYETVSMAMTAAETAHLVFGSLHTNGAPETINRIVDVFPAEEQPQARSQLSQSLRLVMTQQLLKRKGGGRVGAFEVMVNIPAVANLIREAKIVQIQTIMQTGGGNLEKISRARIEIDAMRLMVLQAAKAMDVLGNKEARVYVSAVKAMVPEKVCQIIDDAIQMHGATGISQWSPLPGLYTDMRHLRFADGPDEVHHMVVGRAELQKYDLW